MSPPIIGAALTTNWLPTYRDWLFEKDRDLEIQDFFEPRVFANDDGQPLVEAAKAQLQGFKGRLGIHGPFYGIDIANPDPEGRVLCEKRMMQGLDVCAALGATQMVIHSPFTTWDHNNLDDRPGAREEIYTRVAETLSRVISRCEGDGVELVIENIEDVDPQERRRLAEHLGSDAVRLSIDTGHAHYAHGSNGAHPVDYFVHAAGDMLHHVHLQDADGYADRHWAIGRGTIRWHSVFEALAGVSSNPRLVLELRDAADIPASMAFLEENGLGQ